MDWQRFLKHNTKSMKRKKKTDILDFLKIKNFFALQKTTENDAACLFLPTWAQEKKKKKSKVTKPQGVTLRAVFQGSFLPVFPKCLNPTFDHEYAPLYDEGGGRKRTSTE